MFGLKKAIILAIGNELVEGYIVDTNSKFLSSQLKDIGYYVIRTETLPDNFEIMVERISTALKDADLVITSGGLGPTEDDLTREVVSYVLNRQLKIDESLKEKIYEKVKAYYSEKVPEIVYKQAMVIEKARVLENKVGSAPGQIVEKGGKTILLLPGPPSELIPMFDSVKENLKTNSSLYTKRVKTLGIPEAVLVSDYKEIIYSCKDINIATMASYEKGVEIRFTSSLKNKEKIDEIVERLVKELGDNVYDLDNKTIEEVVYELLSQNNLTVSFAESCTGGMVSSNFVEISGVSKVFKGSIIAYDNSVKTDLLAVKEDILENFGAVSKECVTVMSENIRKILKSDFGVAISGVAGPTGGTIEKPVGTVWIAVSSPKKTVAKGFLFRGDRKMIRTRATLMALDLLRRGVKEWLRKEN